MVFCDIHGMWKLKSIVVLFNAQLFKRGIPIYCRVSERNFLYTLEYMKIISIYQWVCGRTTQYPRCSADKNWQLLCLKMLEHISDLTHHIAKSFTLTKTCFYIFHLSGQDVLKTWIINHAIMMCKDSLFLLIHALFKERVRSYFPKTQKLNNIHPNLKL